MAKKKSASRKTIDGKTLLKRTYKSYSSKEKWVSGLFVFLLVVSGWKLVSGNWEGRDIINVVKGGHNYNEGLVGEIVRLNPVYADLNEVDRDITSLVFDGLAKYDPKQQKVVENVATHTLDESHTVYTFVMKEGITWHDGEPVTAEDVYFTYHDVIQHPEFENPILRNSFSGVTIEQTDDKTITMTLNEPNSFFFTQLTTGLLPQHILGDVEITELDTHEFNQKPLGNGPYKVNQAYTRNQDETTEVALSYNKDYWKDANPDITDINFFTFATYEDLKKGTGQLHGVARVQKYRLEDLQEERLMENQYFLPQYTALFFDTDSEELVKRGVRLGIQKAIEKDKILAAIGYDRAIDTPLLELDQEDWITQPNPKEASGAFFDAGWQLDEESKKRVNEDGDEILEFTLVRRSYPNNEKQEEATKTTAEMVKASLENLGVTITIESYEGEQFQDKVQDREYDLLIYGQSLGYNLDTYSFWHSSQSNTGLNLSNYGNAKADFNIEAIRNSFGDEDEEKLEYLENLGEIIKNDIPAVFLYTPSYYFLVDERIKNIYSTYLLFPHDRFANILEWQVE
jgi:peptide/nickel transport system substrate-binding protein